MQRSESIKELSAALAKAQGELAGAKKDAANPFFKTKYADLASCWEACRYSLSKHGLAVIQLPTVGDKGAGVLTVLSHSSGEWISELLELPVSKEDAQGVGSAITYARRYALCGFVGIAPEDDDGNAAAKSAPAKKAAKVSVAEVRDRIAKLETVAKCITSRNWIMETFTGSDRAELLTLVNEQAASVLTNAARNAKDVEEIEKIQDEARNFALPDKQLSELFDECEKCGEALEAPV